MITNVLLAALFIFIGYTICFLSIIWKMYRMSSSEVIVLQAKLYKVVAQKIKKEEKDEGK